MKLFNKKTLASTLLVGSIVITNVIPSFAFEKGSPDDYCQWLPESQQSGCYHYASDDDVLEIPADPESNKYIIQP